MTIALLANLQDNAPVLPDGDPSRWDDLDSAETIQAILEALRRGGHRAEFFEARVGPPFDVVGALQRYRPDLCFNIAEGHFGPGREAQIPAILEMLRLPHTGSGVLTLALTLDKPMTKRVLHYHELPTPEFQLFGRADEAISADLLVDGGSGTAGDEALRFPLFVKPSREGTGIGVSARSIVHTVDELRDRVGELLAAYRQPVLCERFMTGREFTVGILGNLAPTAARRLNDRTAPNVLPKELTILPTLEVDLHRYDPAEGNAYTNRIKTELVHSFRYTCPAPIAADLADRLRRLSAAVFRVTGCCDVARVDVRLDGDGVPWILEVNPLPGLNPEYSDLVIQAAAAGITYDDLIGRIVEAAAVRHGLVAASPGVRTAGDGARDGEAPGDEVRYGDAWSGPAGERDLRERTRV